MASYTTPDIPLSPASSQAPLHPHASSSRSHSYQNKHSGGLDPYPGEEDDVFDPFSIDPSLRLRTVRTAHSVIAESIRSERDAHERKRKRKLFSSIRRRGTMSTLKDSMRRKGSDPDTHRSSDHEGSVMDITEHGTPKSVKSVKTLSIVKEPEPAVDPKGKGKAKTGLRRTLYVNIGLPVQLLNQKGEPLVRYVRNKVRTSKYTIITFLPKNLFEQFRRAANIYFLALVIIQLFSIFGAPNAQIGMLPLLAILGMTAIKDGVEDWRRAKLDNEVNNSAATKLGGWKNVNQPSDPRSFFERLFGLNPPDRPSKGVRKLRDAEAKAGHEIVMERQNEIDKEEVLGSPDAAGNDTDSIDLAPKLPFSGPQEGVQSRVLRKLPSAQSIASRNSTGVMDWSNTRRGTAHWERTLWKKLEVGDLVLLRDNEQIPADIVILSTSNNDDLAFVETKNLDGETNLKVRKALKATGAMNSEEDLERASFLVDSEPPHANLYSYNGVLKYFPADEDKGTVEKQEAITINELLLRGCTIRNTKWVIGLVVFTGKDTKIMLNGGDTPSKRSKIEKETNFNVVMNFVILLILCIVTAILHGWYRSLSGTSANSYEAGSWASDNIYIDSLIIFVSCLIVFQNIVPISLYITIEIVKTIQAFFIFQDIEMYYEPYDTPCVPKTWNISDDLGQIEYVFSDKTGTLTQNVMEFKKCSIQGIAFGEGLTEAMMGAAKRDGRQVADKDDQAEEMAVLKERMVTEMKRSINNRYFREDKLTLIAPELAKHLANPGDELRPFIIDFFRGLAICHTVLSDIPEPKKPYEVDYKAESPDEAALVAAARDVGFPFINRNNTKIDIEVLGAPERWTPLRVLEFNSTRKRMSVIARDPKGQIVLFCKGADSVIYERLAHDHDPNLKASTLKDLETFANGGLRTLCIAHRHLEEEEFEKWAKKYDAAAAAVEDREAEIEKAAELVEHSLTILGATALEDKLQEGVPESIAMLHQAGIKLWILTGDKLQTAIEIGYSCNLLTNDMEVMIISADSEAGARAQIEAGLNKMASLLGPPPVGRSRSHRIDDSKPAATFAVVIDGDSLRYALQPGLKSLFLSLGTQCSAVICCRVSPSQKALTVKLVKEGCKAMTLSIGDGANDVAMIQEANVGVGLFGLEGSQAAMSADYAFGQFRFLTRLLFVHGRWSYVRIADMHANFFYKNIIWTLSMFWFLMYNSFDATYLFEYTFLLLYNLVLTSLPVGVMGAFDQDTHATASMAFPALYKRGIRGLEYTRTRFWIYMADGLYQSCIIFFIPYIAYSDGITWSSDGLDTNSLWDLGTTIACAGVVSANMYVGINMRYWTFITWIVLFGSTAIIFIWIPIYSALAEPPYQGVVSVIYPTFSFWAIVIVTVFMAVGPRWIANAFRQSYMPRDKDIIREAWVAGNLKDELGVQHRKYRKRAKKAMKDTEVDSAPAIVTRLEQAFSESEDGRGHYQRANVSSPMRSPPHSGTSTPRSPFSYPPQSPVDRAFDGFAASARGSTTLPPPLHSRGSDGTAARPSYSRGPSGGRDAGSKGPSACSPSGLDTFNMTGQEIKRLSVASTDLRRASLHASTQEWSGSQRSKGPSDPLEVGEFGQHEQRGEDGKRKSYVDFSAGGGGW